VQLAQINSYQPEILLRYLSSRDVYIFKAIASEAKLVGEVGVLFGGFAIHALLNSQASRLVGIDPFNWDGGSEARASLEGYVAGAGVSDRFELLSNWQQVDTKDVFDVIHIDGEHSEKATLEDFRRASEVLAGSGVIICDDWSHPMFPGVQSAMHLFMAESDFRLFAVTDRKAYLCRTAHHSDIQNRLVDQLLADKDVSWCWQHGRVPTGYDGESTASDQSGPIGGVANYPIEGMVQGSRVAMVLGPFTVEMSEISKVG
jgi:predicted O-methyltransferase YrrM